MLTFPNMTPDAKKNTYRRKYSLLPDDPPFFATQNARKRKSPVVSRDTDK